MPSPRRSADIAIVTDDNPRSEDPATIRAEIMAVSPKLLQIGDQRRRSEARSRCCTPGDLLVVAGKGHETGQIIGDRTLPFSDHDVVEEGRYRRLKDERRPLWSRRAG